MSDSNEEFTVFADQDRDPTARAIQIRRYLPNGRVQIKISGNFPSSAVDLKSGFGIVLDKQTALDVADKIFHAAGASSAPFERGQLVLDVNTGEVFKTGEARHFPAAGWHIELIDRDGELKGIRYAGDFVFSGGWPPAIGDYYVNVNRGDKIYRVVGPETSEGVWECVDTEGNTTSRSVSVPRWYRRVKVIETVELVATPVWTVVDEVRA